MRVFLKPYVCEKAQSAGMETYISKPNEMAQCIFQQRNLDLLTKFKTCVYGTYLFMYMWVLEFCLWCINLTKKESARSLIRGGGVNFGNLKIETLQH
jgi:hypothetical protein